MCKRHAAEAKKKLEEEIQEPTTFVVMILRPVDPKKDAGVDPNLLALLTGWCIIAAHGLDAAMRHVEKIDLGESLKGAAWKDIAAGGKMASLPDGKMIQVLPAPLYVAECLPEPLIAPPYLM